MLSYSIAFVAGLLSFFSPCVFPVMPGYLCFMMSCTPHDYMDDRDNTRSLWLMSFLVAFVFFLGFATVFIFLGAIASNLHTFFAQHRDVLMKVGAALVIAFGVFTLGWIKIAVLEREVRWHPTERFFKSKDPVPLMISAYLVGIAFGFGWTPCIGPILGSILVLAAHTESVRQGVVLLALYSLGLGIPFIVMALFFRAFMQYMPGFRGSIPTIRRISGAILIGMGMLLWTNSLQALSSIVFGR